MSDFEKTAVPYDATTRKVNGQTPEFASPLRRRKNGAVLKGLVVSSDDEVRRKLAEILGQCGLVAEFASTVTESAVVLTAHEVIVVLCQDSLADGTYEDIVEMADALGAKVPIIVVSRTGDWPEYFTAIGDGAFDYLAYPPIASDLPRIVRNVLLEYKRRRHLEGA